MPCRVQAENKYKREKKDAIMYQILCFIRMFCHNLITVRPYMCRSHKPSIKHHIPVRIKRKEAYDPKITV